MGTPPLGPRPLSRALLEIAIQLFSNLMETNGYIETGGAVRLLAQLYSRRSTRAMFYRRVRSLHDLYLQSADTPMEERYYERRLNELSALIDPEDLVPADAQRDFEKWGSWLHNADGGSAPAVPYTTNNPDVETMAEGVQRLRDEFLAPRRAFIYSQNIFASLTYNDMPFILAPK